MKGITVLGGENSKRLDRGIYVKSVTEGGAAWRDGRLKAGKILLCFYFSMMIKFCSKFKLSCSAVTFNQWISCQWSNRYMYKEQACMVLVILSSSFCHQAFKKYVRFLGYKGPWLGWKDFPGTCNNWPQCKPLMFFTWKIQSPL